MIFEETVRVTEKLRKDLHEIPEKSLSEEKTIRFLEAFLKEQTACNVCRDGKVLAAVLRGKNPFLPTVAFRADFDAVEINGSCVGHFCGHDGHAAILAGFAYLLSRTETERTTVFLFQPAEETGEGALLCLPILRRYDVSEIYGFHNIPGAPIGTVLLTEGTFACASTGLIFTFTGASSHAAYPENGKNPAKAMAELILAMEAEVKKKHRGILLGTVIGLEAGSTSFGVSASKGTLRMTVRGEFREEFEKFREMLLKKAEELAKRDGLVLETEEAEPFPATENDPDCVKKLRKSLADAGLPVLEMKEPFRWSEDFGHYLQTYRGAFFGVGDGENYPQLHTDSYAFPDEIIKTVFCVYWEIQKKQM